jgi:hypothetical protein
MDEDKTPQKTENNQSKENPKEEVSKPLIIISIIIYLKYSQEK